MQRLHREVTVSSVGYEISFESVYHDKKNDKLIAVINLKKPSRLSASIIVTNTIEALVEVPEGKEPLPTKYYIKGPNSHDQEDRLVEGLSEAEIQEYTQGLPKIKFTPIQTDSHNHVKTYRESVPDDITKNSKKNSLGLFSNIGPVATAAAVGAAAIVFISLTFR